MFRALRRVPRPLGTGAVGVSRGLRIAVGRPCVRNFSAPSQFVQNHSKPHGEPILESDAALSPALQTLAARLKVQDISYATLARTLITDTSSLKYTSNAGMAKFGRTLLSFYVYEHIMAKYPRLPPRVLKHVVDVYTGTKPLSELATSWGVQTDTRTALTRHLADVSDAQALGRLTFAEKIEQVEHGVTEIKTGDTLSQSAAMGIFVRALVAAVYAHRGLDGAREFVYDYVIRPRRLDLTTVMAFSRPTRELAVLCAREGLEEPVSRLLAESGRYSHAPVYVVGVFSGAQKLGEGQGSSLREARTRAAVNALQSWYLYSPEPGAEKVAPQASQYIDPGEIVI